MLNKDFYALLDAELQQIQQKYAEDPFLKKHHKAPTNQRAYAFLIWFLEFYARKTGYASYITEGDGDASCDIVFSLSDQHGKPIFYIVQSKWRNAKNAELPSSKDEILKALSDFSAILHREKQVQPPLLQEKLRELYKHINENGELRFIFLSLSVYAGDADDNIRAFEKEHPHTSVKIIDLPRIKIDYIDRQYKEIKPNNPFETYKDPEENPLKLAIVQQGGRVQIDAPYQSYVFLVRPKALWQLFKDYGFLLFHKNIRNPLLQSSFNKEIEKTALENPANFWYYNNGITAITYLMPKAINKQATVLDLLGLQVINGAQTIHAIYSAYEQASEARRQRMDAEVLVTFRLLKSGGKEFDLRVSRFTNSQNPTEDRDFFANDEVQLRLQNESFATPIWYEKRRGEFRHLPAGVVSVSNAELAAMYICYYLQMPFLLPNIKSAKLSQNIDLCFALREEHPEGIYEQVFNEQTEYKDMLAAYIVYDLIATTTKVSFPNIEEFKNNSFNFLYSNFSFAVPAFRLICEKYMLAKGWKGKKVSEFIVEEFGKNGILPCLCAYTLVQFLTYTKSLEGDKKLDFVLLRQKAFTEFMNALAKENFSAAEAEMPLDKSPLRHMNLLAAQIRS